MKFWQNKSKVAQAFPEEGKGEVPSIDRKYQDIQIETATFALG